MSRADLRVALTAYATAHPDEAATARRFLDLIDARPDCYLRTCWEPGHITASAWLVDRAGARVLLTHHRKLGRWLQLGGHADGDENPLRVAMREAREESGLAVGPVSSQLFDIDVHVIPARGADPAHLHYDLRFALRVVESEAFAVSEESHALRWVPIDGIETLTDEPSILRMAAKWRVQ
jgi:8-oxo-dGTP pyrophosphatase MutT (NUDIX family)